MPTVTFPGRPLVSYPGLRLFYQLFNLGTIIIRLPIWIIRYSFQNGRPVPTWSFKKSLVMRLFGEALRMWSETEPPVPLPLEPGGEKDRWEIIEPFPKGMYRGPLESKDVEPAIIGGTWYPERPADPAKAGPIILHIHGGAFVLGDGRIKASGPMFDLLSKHGETGPAFALQYRLSSRPTSAPFPAALQDSLTSYLYFVRNLGVPASNITVSGDSAGGNLVIGLLRYIVEHPELSIPQPRCAFLISPWVAPVKFLWPGIVVESNPNYNSDYLGRALCLWGAKTYIGDAPPQHPYIVPLGSPFKTPVPMLVTFGAVEILAIDGVDWMREMGGVEGNELETYMEPDAPHDTAVIGHVLGFEESSAQVAKKIGEFVRYHHGRAQMKA
ncbi:alpha/beta hydrolase fold-3 domain-containing protein [Astrocystis sublimbata]|nr:alpha/beta hydrolase fold-3 domain-containing protein [Astrocystis sublimbata]